MRPHPASIMGGTAARAIRYGPTTFVSITVRQAFGATVQKRVGTVMNVSLTVFIPRPALLTRTSSRPKRSNAASTSRMQSSSRVTSAMSGTMRRSPNRRAASSATASISAPWRAAEMMTRAPASASASAIARPMPRPPPVTIATRERRGMPLSDRDQAGFAAEKIYSTLSKESTGKP